MDNTSIILYLRYSITVQSKNHFFFFFLKISIYSREVRIFWLWESSWEVYISHKILILNKFSPESWLSLSIAYIFLLFTGIMNGLMFSKLMNYLGTEVSTFNKLNSKDWCCKKWCCVYIFALFLAFYTP